MTKIVNFVFYFLFFQKKQRKKTKEAKLSTKHSFLKYEKSLIGWWNCNVSTTFDENDFINLIISWCLWITLQTTKWLMFLFFYFSFFLFHSSSFKKRRRKWKKKKIKVFYHFLTGSWTSWNSKINFSLVITCFENNSKLSINHSFSKYKKYLNGWWNCNVLTTFDEYDAINLIISWCLWISSQITKMVNFFFFLLFFLFLSFFFFQKEKKKMKEKKN